MTPWPTTSAPPRIEQEAQPDIDELRSVIAANGRDWLALLVSALDGEAGRTRPDYS